jgi:hypothetical protein
VHHCVIRQDSYNAPTNTHTSSEFLVAHDAVSFVCDGNVPVTPALPSLYIVAKVQPRRDRDTFSLSQTSNDPCLVDKTICRSNAASEVRLQ